MVFRSPLRPSSPPDAKAFTICSSYLDLPLLLALPLVCQRSNSKTQSFRFESGIVIGGGERDRTDDPLLAKQVLSQLSYTPSSVVGLVGIEPTTSRLSGVRSSHLSYRPELGSVVFKEHASILQNRIVEGLFCLG